MIEWIELKYFRNHEHLKLALDSKTTFLEGSNGSGKTSVLEAIYFSGLLKSHRTSDDKALIQETKPFARINLKTTKHLYQTTISPTGKHLKIDGKPILKMSEYIGGYKVIIFSPEDLDLIKGIPGIRRSFLDIEMFQIDDSYARILNVYKKVLKQRNALLKRLTLKDDLTFIKILNKRLMSEADKIIERRKIFISDLNQAFIKRFKAFNETDRVMLIYEPNTEINTLESMLNERIQKDILSKNTNIGPHRDDFKVLYNGLDAKQYASQGQQRLITIALKLSVIDLLKEKNQIVILLDDVMSELDSQTVKSLESLIHSKYQTIITGIKSNYDNIQTINLDNKGEIIDGQ